jgi:hypothetical protein
VAPNTAGNRIEREQEIDARDGDEDDEQRGRHPAPVDAGEHPSARVAVGDRHYAAGGAHNAVVLDVGVLVAVAEELYRGEHEQETEDREHEVEGRTEDGAKGDEDRAHDERDQDSEVRTRCWYSAGTANVVIITTKTKRLSTDRLFSTM